MSTSKIITVFGATGKQGGGVVDIFLKDPKLNSTWKVRGITRNVESESAKKLTSQGVEMVSADINDKASLNKALQGSYAVFAITDYWSSMSKSTEIQQGKNIADAAKETGVEHYIFSTLKNVTKITNGQLTNVEHFDSKAEAADYVRSLGIPTTFFLPGYFATNLDGMHAISQIPDNNGKPTWTMPMPIDGAKAQIPVFVPSDTGKYVKAIVLNREKLLGKEVLAATAYETPDQVMVDFKTAFPQSAPDARFMTVPDQAYVDTLTGSGLPPHAATELMENMKLFQIGGYFGGESLEPSLAILEDKPTTLVEYFKSSSFAKECK